MHTMMGIFKGKSQTITYPCKQTKGRHVSVPCGSLSLCSRNTFLPCNLVTHASSIFKFRERTFRCVLLSFHLCILRILNDWPEITDSSSAQKCTYGPFPAPGFYNIPKFSDSLQAIPTKAPVDLMVSVPPNTSYILLPTYVGPSRQVCQTHKVTECLTFFEWSVVLIYTYKNQKGIWALLPSAHKTIDLRRKRLHLARVFAKTPVWCADLMPARLVGLAN